jgi:transcriptional regulator with XRE-family HTH domain
MIKAAGLKATRIAAGLSQVSLSIKTGIKQTDISALEHGHREPRLSTLVKLADALHVSLDALVGRTPKPRRRGK